MRRTITGVFRSVTQAERAIDEIELQGYANNQISVVLKKTSEHGENHTGESLIDPTAGSLHDFNSVLVQADTIDLPEVGTVSAGGPLAGALVQGDKSLAESLTYYGVSGEYAAQLENFVSDGFFLTVIETNNSKASEVSNLLNKFGAHMVQKWSKTIDKPLRPWN
ncbi:general stress protein [Phosphitispora fastidiosa]|uniref:general stress protein n=1 Tax=Phosphitispora fastidiosa TaxID=2837202 RepID=UPI001E4B8F32|nr:general stress protein [Phosphitispora fastidiosa]MBU7005300.1 hypothetical protein [Phosphitispora fastidiosa]